MDETTTNANTSTSTPEIPPAAVPAVSGARDSLPVQSVGVTFDGLLPPTTANPWISASARTSYTRVDLPNPDAGEASDNPVEMEGDRSLEPVQDSATHDNTHEPQDGDATVPHEPQVSLTFLLVSGQRKTIAYGAETTVVRVKELVWNAWPGEWQEERPPSPSYLRILYLGKILQDDDTLTKVGFPTYTPSPQSSRPSTPPPSTIVHLSIRAYAPPGSDDAPKKKGRRRRSEAGGPPDESAEDGTGCCSSCVIC